ISILSNKNLPLPASLALNSITVSAVAPSTIISLSAQPGVKDISLSASSDVPAFNTRTVTVASGSKDPLSLHLAAVNFTLTSAQPAMVVNAGVARYPTVLPAVPILTKPGLSYTLHPDHPSDPL